VAPINGSDRLIGDWQTVSANNEICCEDKIIQLEPKAMAVLLYLAKHQNRAVPIQELLDNLWQGIKVGDNTIRRLITQLRKAFGDDSKQPRYIDTVPRKGYRLIAKVSPVPIINKTLLSNKPKFIIATLSLLFVLVITWLSSTLYKDVHWLEEGVISLVTNLPGRELAPSFSPDGKAIIFAHAESNSGRYNLRIQKMSDNSSYTLGGIKGNPFSPTWSPDGKHIAYTDMQGCNIVVAEIATDWKSLINPKQIHSCGEYTFPQLAFSSDGNNLYFSDQNSDSGFISHLRYALDTGEKKRLRFENSELENNYFKLLPHPHKKLWILLSFANDKTKVWSYNPVKKQSKQLYSFEGFSHHLDFCGANNTAIIFGEDEQLVKIGLDGNHQKFEFNEVSEFSYLTCSPSENALLFASRRRHHSLVRQANPRLVNAPKLQNQFVFRSSQNEESPVYSSQGNKLAFISDRSGDWQLWSAGKKPPTLVSQHKYSSKPSILAWSIDDTQLLILIASRLAVINIAEGNRQWLTTEQELVGSADWSSDNKTVFYNSKKTGNIYRLDLETKNGIPEMVSAGNQILIGKDGRYIYYTKLDHPGLWQLNLERGHEQLLTELIPGSSQMQITSQGIYFHHHINQSGLYYFNFSRGDVENVLVNFDDQGHDFSVSSDETEITYISWDNYQSDLKILTMH
jgi:DNA-binding winged helix-turn-helix (wHTH) protein/Tol biopolymer transport system component